MNGPSTWIEDLVLRTVRATARVERVFAMAENFVLERGSHLANLTMTSSPAQTGEPGPARLTPACAPDLRRYRTG